MTPLVSVIITTYNAAPYLSAAVDSVLAQTYRDFEVLLIDDGSTDNTCQVLEPYLDRLRYIYQDNQERSAARNNGMQHAAGSWIAFLDGDDAWTPDKLATQVAALQRYPQAVMAYGCARIVDEQGHPTTWWGHQTIGSLEGEAGLVQEGPEILFGSPINPSITLIRRESLEQAGGFDPTIHQGIGEDWDLWIRLSNLGAFARLPQILALYRTYGTDRELRKRASSYYIDRSVYIIRKNAAANPRRFPEALVRQAEGRIYFQSAMASFELGQVENGGQVLSRAVQIEPSLGERKFLEGHLEHTALRLLRDGRTETGVVAFLSQLISALPDTMRYPGLTVGQVLARAHLHEVFRSHQRQDWSGVRRSIWRGLARDPRWLFNRGVLSIALQSLLRR